MKRITIFLASMALVASGFQALPAAAQEEAAPAIPEVVQIEDPVNDGNFLNDQGFRADTGFHGDNVTPADGSTVGDLMKIWFTNDAETVSLNIQTQAAGPAATTIVYQAFTNAGEGPAGSSVVGCLRWYGLIPGEYSGQKTTYQGEPVIKLVDRCNDGTSVYSNGAEGEFTISAGPEDSGILTMTFPRSYSPFLTGGPLTKPHVTSSIAAGADGAGNSAPLMIDNTIDGADYTFTAGEVVEPTPPGKNDPPGKKKGCAKGKGKKRGCEGKGKKAPKPGKPSDSCAAFTPGEAGAEAKTLVVSDAATEAKPLEEALTFDSAIPLESSSTNYVNLQVDSAASTAGLYAYIEFTPRNDYDLNLLHPDGSYAAQSHGFNPLIEINDVELPLIGFFSSTGHGGESTASSEKLVGIKTDDCGGWTLDVTNYAGPGEEVTLQLWLGEAKTDPSPEGEVTP